MMIWNPKRECMSRDEIESLQWPRLQATIQNVYEHNAHYRAKMDAIGLEPGDIKCLEDLQYMPFTVKDDLRETYPYGMMAVPMSEVVRVHGSSGTTGKPIIVGYTRKDLDTWSELLARIITAAGVTKNDIAQMAFNYGLFTGGFGLHYGLEKVGATVIPMSGGNTRKQLMMMQDMKSTVLISTPSYALHIAEVAEEMGIDMSKMPLRTALFGGEPWTDEMRKEIEGRLHLLATDNYGLTEVMGPGVSGECALATGLHIAEDHFIVETIDPETGKVLPPGSKGELVFTSLTKEAFPIIRYRTKDISIIDQRPCACGRTNARMCKVIGRVDDMMVIRGVNVFPSQLEEILLGFKELGPQYQLHVYREGYLDTLEVYVELVDTTLLTSYGALENLTKRIKGRIKSVLGLQCDVKLAEPGRFERTAGKAKRVFDHRGDKVSF
jgi:phenylacetate-CoA ligase